MTTEVINITKEKINPNETLREDDIVLLKKFASQEWNGKQLKDGLKRIYNDKEFKKAA